MLESILNIFFPKRCLVCNKINQKILCQKCYDYLKKSNTREILYCQPLDEVYSLGLYEDKVFKKVIHLFKYNKKKELADILGQLLIDFCSKQKIYLKIDKVVPVPLHFKKLRQRRFNQAQLLAEKTAKYFKLDLEENLLIKAKSTLSQSELNRERRFENVKDAFIVNQDKLPLEGTFLIVDDVITTGATVAECARVLKKSGAEKVIVLTLVQQIIAKNL